VVEGVRHAALWRGRAEELVDLQSFLPDRYASSWAEGVDVEPDGTIVVVGHAVGHAVDRASGRREAILWRSVDRVVTFIRGGANGDGDHDVSDVVFTLGLLFQNEENSAIACHDAIFSFLALFAGGHSPPAPYPTCGVADTGGLGCVDNAFCGESSVRESVRRTASGGSARRLFSSMPRADSMFSVRGGALDADSLGELEDLGLLRVCVSSARGFRARFSSRRRFGGRLAGLSIRHRGRPWKRVVEVGSPAVGYPELLPANRHNCLRNGVKNSAMRCDGREPVEVVMWGQPTAQSRAREIQRPLTT